MGYISEKLSSFIKASGQSPSMITLVGHSIGAHIAATSSRNLNSSIFQVVGLDPAAPFFGSSEMERIRASDARVVHNIHTSSIIIGLLQPTGLADFYPDAGLPISQPGCNQENIEDRITCSHERCYILYAQSIRTGGLIATRCPSYNAFAVNICENQPTAYLGQLILDKR